MKVELSCGGVLEAEVSADIVKLHLETGDPTALNGIDMFNDHFHTLKLCNIAVWKNDLEEIANLFDDLAKEARND